MTAAKFDRLGLIICFLLAWVFLLSVLFVAHVWPYEEKKEFFVMDMNWREFPGNAEIVCEPGPVIENYITKKIVYGCLRVVDGRCAGDGKQCYAVYDVRREGR